MDLEPKQKSKHLELGITLLGAGIAVFLVIFFFFNIVMAVMKFIFYCFVAILIGGAIHEFNEAFNKNETSRRIKSGIWFTIKKIIFPLGLLGITVRYYYEILNEGIDSFHYPMVGIFIAIILPLLCILYVLIFMRKYKSKLPIGK